MSVGEVEPSGYLGVLASIKAEVRAAQLRAHRVVNTELQRLYLRIGQTIIERREAEGWGARVTDRLAADLRAEFPDMRGFSGRNLRYMATAAAAWPDGEVGQQVVAQLPWGHVTVLLDRLDDQAQRDWYASAAVKNDWSRNVLLNQIKNRLHERRAAAPSNFATQLPADESELAQELTRDPYVFDFLGLTDRVAERDLEQALMDKLTDTLLELGRGFAFVGRQVHFDVDGDDFYIDLLLFHVTQLRYVVVELKIGKFKPEYTGQLGFYIALVDDELRDTQRHSPTVGILLCAGRNDRVVRYALSAAAAPMAVADYTYDTLPAAEQQALPTAADLTAVVETTMQDAGWRSISQLGGPVAEAAPDLSDEARDERGLQP